MKLKPPGTPYGGAPMQTRDILAQDYAAIYTPEVLAALTFMAGFNDEQ